MSVASVTPLGSARGHKPSRAERKVASARRRLPGAKAKATTPGQYIAAALDYLRIVLSVADPKIAAAEATRIHNELVAHADRIASNPLREGSK